MRVIQAMVLAAMIVAMPVLAAEPVTRRLQAVPVEYVSPGASGSIESSSHTRRYEVYAGHAVPTERGGAQRQAFGRSVVQQQGGIRQRSEYPGGLVVPRYPGQDHYEQRRSR